MTDEEIIKMFRPYRGRSKPGFMIDFLGTQTRTKYISSLKGNVVESYPIPRNFHATAREWAGCLRAALEGKDTLVAIELGAGWAPWLVALARAGQQRGIKKFKLVGVEASKQHCEYMKTHFEDNGLRPSQTTILHGVAGTHDGKAYFPVLHNPSSQWGSAPLGSLRFIRKSTLPARFEQLPAYSLRKIVDPYDSVDLIHADIQGDEYKVVKSARGTLRKKVKRLVIATHSRSIERQLKTLLSGDWELEAEEKCTFRRSRLRRVVALDGCQVWRNAYLPQ